MFLRFFNNPNYLAVKRDDFTASWNEWRQHSARTGVVGDCSIEAMEVDIDTDDDTKM